MHRHPRGRTAALLGLVMLALSLITFGQAGPVRPADNGNPKHTPPTPYISRAEDLRQVPFAPGGLQR